MSRIPRPDKNQRPPLELIVDNTDKQLFDVFRSQDNFFLLRYIAFGAEIENQPNFRNLSQELQGSVQRLFFARLRQQHNIPPSITVGFSPNKNICLSFKPHSDDLKFFSQSFDCVSCGSQKALDSTVAQKFETLKAAIFQKHFDNVETYRNSSTRHNLKIEELFACSGLPITVIGGKPFFRFTLAVSMYGSRDSSAPSLKQGVTYRVAAIRPDQRLVGVYEEHPDGTCTQVSKTLLIDTIASNPLWFQVPKPKVYVKLAERFGFATPESAQDVFTRSGYWTFNEQGIQCGARITDVSDTEVTLGVNNSTQTQKISTSTFLQAVQQGDVQLNQAVEQIKTAQPPDLKVSTPYPVEFHDELVEATATRFAPGLCTNDVLSKAQIVGFEGDKGRSYSMQSVRCEHGRVSCAFTAQGMPHDLQLTSASVIAAHLIGKVKTLSHQPQPKPAAPIGAPQAERSRPVPAQPQIPIQGPSQPPAPVIPPPVTSTQSPERPKVESPKIEPPKVETKKPEPVKTATSFESLQWNESELDYLYRQQKDLNKSLCAAIATLRSLGFSNFEAPIQDDRSRLDGQNTNYKTVVGFYRFRAENRAICSQLLRFFGTDWYPVPEELNTEPQHHAAIMQLPEMSNNIARWEKIEFGWKDSGWDTEQPLPVQEDVRERQTWIDYTTRLQGIYDAVFEAIEQKRKQGQVGEPEDRGYITTQDSIRLTGGEFAWFSKYVDISVSKFLLKDIQSYARKLRLMCAVKVAAYELNDITVPPLPDENTNVEAAEIEMQYNQEFNTTELWKQRLWEQEDINGRLRTAIRLFNTLGFANFTLPKVLEAPDKKADDVDWSTFAHNARAQNRSMYKQLASFFQPEWFTALRAQLADAAWADAQQGAGSPVITPGVQAMELGWDAPTESVALNTEVEQQWKKYIEDLQKINQGMKNAVSQQVLQEKQQAYQEMLGALMLDANSFNASSLSSTIVEKFARSLRLLCMVFVESYQLNNMTIPPLPDGKTHIDAQQDVPDRPTDFTNDRRPFTPSEANREFLAALPLNNYSGEPSFPPDREEDADGNNGPVTRLGAESSIPEPSTRTNAPIPEKPTSLEVVDYDALEKKWKDSITKQANINAALLRAIQALKTKQPNNQKVRALLERKVPWMEAEQSSVDLEIHKRVWRRFEEANQAMFQDLQKVGNYTIDFEPYPTPETKEKDDWYASLSDSADYSLHNDSFLRVLNDDDRWKYLLDQQLRVNAVLYTQFKDTFSSAYKLIKERINHLCQDSVRPCAEAYYRARYMNIIMLQVIQNNNKSFDYVFQQTLPYDKVIEEFMWVTGLTVQRRVYEALRERIKTYNNQTQNRGATITLISVDGIEHPQDGKLMSVVELKLLWHKMHKAMDEMLKAMRRVGANFGFTSNPYPTPWTQESDLEMVSEQLQKEWEFKQSQDRGQVSVVKTRRVTGGDSLDQPQESREDLQKRLDKERAEQEAKQIRERAVKIWTAIEQQNTHFKQLKTCYDQLATEAESTPFWKFWLFSRVKQINELPDIDAIGLSDLGISTQQVTAEECITAIEGILNATDSINTLSNRFIDVVSSHERAHRALRILLPDDQQLKNMNPTISWPLFNDLS